MLMTTFLLPSKAQTQYISNSRLAAEDRFEDLGGDGGILLLSRHKDLVIALPNVKEKSIRLNGERPDGLYEYCVIVKANETRTPKLEISRRGNVYKTEIVLTIKPDFLMAFQVEEVQNPIRTDEQTMANDAYLDASSAMLEFSTTIKGLKIDCSPSLNAEIQSSPSPSDPSIMIHTVKIPVKVLNDAKNRIAELQQALAQQDAITGGENVSEADWDKLDQLDEELNEAENRYNALTSIEIYADGTNRLAIDISALGGRAKKCYAVLPIVVEKDVYVTQCSAFMNEAGRLFDMRKYKEARMAYEDAWNSEDIVATLRPAIRESIAQCDSCMLYESLATRAIKKIAALKESGNATQEEVARYASAALEFMEMVNSYNPDDFYRSRIERMEQLLAGMPLKIKFTVVEWKTLNEGDKIPGVEIWAYHGLSTFSSNSFSSDRKFEKILKKEEVNFKQIGVSGLDGVVEIELDRKNLPLGLLFRPGNNDIKIKYMTITELMHQVRGTYMEKQFRLKMYVK